MIPEGQEKDYIMEQMGAGHYSFLLDEPGGIPGGSHGRINPQNPDKFPKQNY